MDILLVEFGLVLGLCALLGSVARFLRLPPILGYIFVGLILSVFMFDQNTETMLEFFSHLGVAFLLFMLGLELNVREIHEVGPVALWTGVGQVVITSIVGFISALFFGFSTIESLYIAVALTFSSTIVIVKLLGEKGDLNSQYGRIAVGFLIVQDVIAVIALIVLNFVGSASVSADSIVQSLVSVLAIGILLIGFAFILGRILGQLLQNFGKTSELVLVSVMAWAIMFSVYTQSLGLSLEVGAFLAGISLATSRVSLEIAAKIKPLRDFFISMFFVVLGLGLSLDGLALHLPKIIAFSLLVLVGNPLILLAIMGIMGYHRRISFLAGLTVSQISEFSLILIATGVSFGQVQPETMTLVTGVAIITLVGSSYLISRGEFLYRLVATPLKIFERKRLRPDFKTVGEKGMYQAVILGAHRMGEEIVDVLKKQHISFIVVDYDPAIVRGLTKRNIPAIYGDVSDPELLSELEIAKIKVLISTVPSFEDNELLLGEFDSGIALESRPYIIMRANDAQQAEVLKKHGADTVLVPEVVAGDKIVRLLHENGFIKTISKQRKVEEYSNKVRNRS